MSADAGRIIRKERIAAPPDAVWHAWTDPQGLAAWFVDRASGTAEPGAEMTWHWDAFGLDARVRVLEARPPERLVLEMADAPGGARLLEIDLRGEGGGTVLRIVESGFRADDPAAGDSESGWTLALGVLRIALEQYAGRRRHEVLVLRPSPAEAVPLDLYSTRTGLDRWLCDGRGSVPGAGRFDGMLATASSHEALWTWPAHSGALELKTFGRGGGRMVGVRLSRWSDDALPAGDVNAALTEAVARLCALLAQ